MCVCVCVCVCWRVLAGACVRACLSVWYASTRLDDSFPAVLWQELRRVVLEIIYSAHVGRGKQWSLLNAIDGLRLTMSKATLCIRTQA